MPGHGGASISISRGGEAGPPSFPARDSGMTDTVRPPQCPSSVVVKRWVSRGNRTVNPADWCGAAPPLWECVRVLVHRSFLGGISHLRLEPELTRVRAQTPGPVATFPVPFLRAHTRDVATRRGSVRNRRLSPREEPEQSFPRDRHHRNKLIGLTCIKGQGEP